MANVIKLMSSFYRRSSLPIFSTQCVRLSSFQKDLWRTTAKENQIASTSYNDILLASLKSSSTAETVLDLVNSHARVMNNKHLMQALRSLFALQKRGQSELNTRQILTHPHFDLLCKSLKRQAGAIELNDTIEALKVVCYVGVGSSSTIVQVLLHLLKHQINALSLQQIIFLDFLLNQMKPTPLIEAMQIALPLVFEIQLPLKMDPDDIQQMADYLFYASKKNVSPKCVELLVHSIMQYRNAIEIKTVISLLWSLCDLNANEFFEPLLKKFIGELIVDIDCLSFDELETTLSKLLSKYSRRFPFYYSDVLCDMIGNHVVDNKLGHVSGIYVLKKLQQFTHSNDALLNYVSEQFVQDEGKFHTADALLACTYINSLALTDFRPTDWETIKFTISRSPVFENTEKRDFQWLRLAANLAILNIFKTDVFVKAFRESYLKKVFESNFLSDFDNLLLIKQYIMTFAPDLEYVLPSEEIFKNAAAARVKATVDFQLEGSLLHIFGGEKYVKTGVTTNLYHYIDHVVILKKDGQPVAFASKSSPKTLEEINLHPNSQLLAIIGLGPQHFTVNSKRLRSNTGLVLKTIEKLGATVIAVNLHDWKQLADYERIPYIMQMIKNKTDVADVCADVSA